jgi:hypothetical protein
MRSLVSRFGFGLLYTVVVIVLAIVGTAIWGEIYDRWGWRELAAGLLVLGAMAFALLEEAVRPGNPYRHLNPLYGMQDVAGTGKLDSGGSGWMWNALPPVVAAVILVIAF